MILYHFTPLQTVFGEDFGELVAQGQRDLPITLTELTPAAAKDSYPGMPPVVWLTADPCPGGPAEQCSFARMKLIVPSRDRRLYPYKTFMHRLAHKLIPGISDAEIAEEFLALPVYRRALRAWWVYEGTIPQSRWAGIELARNQQVWWGSLDGHQIGLRPAQADAAE
jgi:hypothetical protein